MSANSVSVIIPCYNGAKFLPEAIESVLSQTYPPFEIIVVDDGSTDNTREVAACYPSVRYIRQENQGVAKARNQGIHESQSNYLVFLDHDDRLLPNALEVGVDYLNAHPDCGLVFGFCMGIGADGLPLPGQSEKPIENASYQTILSGRSLAPPATVMFRRTVFELVGGFDTSWALVEDFEIYLRVARVFPIYCHNQLIVEYRRHDNNQSGNVAGIVEGTLQVLDIQWEFIRGNKAYEAAYRNGKKHWINLFGPYIAYSTIAHLKARRWTAAVRGMLLLLRHYPQGFVKYASELLSKLTSRFTLSRT